MKQRVSAILIKGEKILLIRRIKPDNEYYTLPGGTVEEGEEVESALIREVREELSVDVKSKRLAFMTESPERIDYYFLISDWSGNIQLGGPELGRMNEQNKYNLEWIAREQLEDLENIHPSAEDSKERISKLWDNKEI